MQLIKPGINIDFIGKTKIAFAGSLLLIVVSIASLIVKGGPKYGIDFAGGTLIQVGFSKDVSADQIRAALNALNLDITSIQNFGTTQGATPQDIRYEYLIRANKSASVIETLDKRLKDALTAAFPGAHPAISRLEMVGPKVGKDLREKALLAMFSAILFIVVYISGRFELKWTLSIIMASCLFVTLFVAKGFGVSIPVLILIAVVITLGLSVYLKLKFATGAIVALLHDVTITVGVFSLLDKDFTLPIIAALLTIIGYSLNDTIIVFDRIRENTRKHLRQPYDWVVNRSINETLSRTLLTSLTTLVVVIALFVLGGGIIHDFAFALIVGIIVGTYSSIYVASPILIVWQQASRAVQIRVRNIKPTVNRRAKPAKKTR
ncbi:MAG: protein translocase subunit SecF [Deltaproteobacteria bacterium]|nr:protein translocase subunit SecF [Deltaproteobacteria bacterium]